MIDVENVISGFFKGLIWSTGFTFVLLSALLVGPKIENNYFPVLDNFVAHKIRSDYGYNIYNVEFDKIRDCEVTPDSVTWYVRDVNNRLDRVLIEFPPKYGDVSRPIGPQKSKNWIVYNKEYEISQQKLVIFYNCHPLWRTKTELIIKDD